MSGDNTLTAAHQAVEEGAGVRVLPGRAHVEASGRHRARFLHNMTTCEVNQLSPGHGTFGLTVDRGGKLVGQLFLDVDTETIRVEVDAALRERIVGHWVQHRVADMIRFSDVDGLAVIALVGPRAATVLDSASEGAASTLGVHQWLDTSVSGISCRLRRNDDRLAQIGFDLTVAEADSAALVSALQDAGAVALPEAAWDAARIVNGVPSDRVDMNEENIPLESEHLIRGISWNKGCYIGQEVIARMHFRGNPNRHLRGLRLSGETPKVGELLFTAEGKEAGVVGTTGVDPTSGATIALAVVKRRFSEVGTALSTEAGTSAEVLKVPFSEGTDATESASD
ncbi:MAG: YgfZ/GcvT domain-containing protein [Myxococcota bacterium]